MRPLSWNRYKSVMFFGKPGRRDKYWLNRSKLSATWTENSHLIRRRSSNPCLLCVMIIFVETIVLARMVSCLHHKSGFKSSYTAAYYHYSILKKLALHKDTVHQSLQTRLLAKLVLLNHSCHFIGPYTTYGSTKADNAVLRDSQNSKVRWPLR